MELLPEGCMQVRVDQNGHFSDQNVKRMLDVLIFVTEIDKDVVRWYTDEELQYLKCRFQ
jgi:hypothetical protein